LRTRCLDILGVRVLVTDGNQILLARHFH
jgi:hypothetical protein